MPLIHKKITNKLKLIDKYIIDFKKKTNDDLMKYLFNIDRKEKRKIRVNLIQKLSIYKILQIVNESIPEYLLHRCDSIVKNDRNAEIVILKKIFLRICINHGFSRNDVMSVLNVDHTTLIYYNKYLNNAFEVVNNYESIISTYNIILEKINLENARLLQNHGKQQLDTESNLSFILNPEPNSSGKDKCEHGIESAQSRMGQPVKQYVNRKVYSIFESN